MFRLSARHVLRSLCSYWPSAGIDNGYDPIKRLCRQSWREQSGANRLFSGIYGISSGGNLNIITETFNIIIQRSPVDTRSHLYNVRTVHFHMMSTNASRHYGEWALSSWYDILPGPDRLLEVSTSLNEDDAWRMVHSWSAKLLNAAVGSEKLQGIADSLVQQHWNQAKRMGCLGIQFTYINGFYHRFIWRSS